MLFPLRVGQKVGPSMGLIENRVPQKLLIDHHFPREITIDVVFPMFEQTLIWLVVWNMFYISICWGCHHPN